MIYRPFAALLVIATLLLSLPALMMPAAAQRAGEGLYILDEVTIDASRGEISIDLSGSVGAVRALRVRTPSDPLKLTNIRVTFSDGTSFDERRPINLLPGERTRPIDEQSGDRFVDSLTLSVDPTTTLKGPVRVQIIAHQTREGRRMRRPASDATATREVANATEVAKPVSPEPQRRSTGTLIETAAPSETGSGEVLFAAQRVALGLDADVIRVSDAIGRFRRVRLRVLENDVSLTGVTVVYRDGRSQPVDLSADVGRNQSTDWFEVDPGRFISELRVSYKADPAFRGRARIEAIGAFAENWLGPNGTGRRYNDGWVLLGAQTAGFVGFDDDTVPVGLNGGGFRQVRFNVRDRAITLNEMQIVYADGSSQTVPIKARVDAGSSYGPVPVETAHHGIREIKARYRSRFFDREASGKGAAIVEVWARY